MNVDVPAVIGVPVMAPVLALIERPAGRLPTLMVNVSGANPPVAETVWLYAVPTVPPGNEVVVMLGAPAGFTFMVSEADVAESGPALLESVTLTVKVDVPAAVGVPVIAPVLPFKFKPAGRLPEASV